MFMRRALGSGSGFWSCLAPWSSVPSLEPRSALETFSRGVWFSVVDAMTQPGVPGPRVGILSLVLSIIFSHIFSHR